MKTLPDLLEHAETHRLRVVVLALADRHAEAQAFWGAAVALGKPVKGKTAETWRRIAMRRWTALLRVTEAALRTDDDRRAFARAYIASVRARLSGGAR